MQLDITEIYATLTRVLHLNSYCLGFEIMWLVCLYILLYLFICLLCASYLNFDSQSWESLHTWKIDTTKSSYLKYIFLFILRFYKVKHSIPSCQIHVFCHSPVGLGSRIRWLYLWRGIKTPPHKACSGYDTKLSDEEAPIQELWGISLSLLPSPL